MAKVDERGRFLIQNVPAGNYTLIVNAMTGQVGGPGRGGRGASPISAQQTVTAIEGHLTECADCRSRLEEARKFRTEAFGMLENLDEDLPQYISDNTDDEISHAQFLNAYLKSQGAQPVNLDAFRTLPSSRAKGAKQIGRLTNLMELDVDTSWYTRYKHNKARHNTEVRLGVVENTRHTRCSFASCAHQAWR
jgi:hypothetical protein